MKTILHTENNIKSDIEEAIFSIKHNMQSNLQLMDQKEEASKKKLIAEDILLLKDPMTEEDIITENQHDAAINKAVNSSVKLVKDFNHEEPKGNVDSLKDHLVQNFDQIITSSDQANTNSNNEINLKNLTTEQLMHALLKPYIQGWVDKNLSTYIKNIVKHELQKSSN